jgi:hypothetical protein
MDNICNFTLEFEGRNISAELRKMLEMFLEKDPARRASLDQLKKCDFIQMAEESSPESQRPSPSIKAEKKIESFKGFTLF